MEDGSGDVEEGIRRGAFWDCLEFTARVTRIAGMVKRFWKDGESRGRLPEF